MQGALPHVGYVCCLVGLLFGCPCFLDARPGRPDRGTLRQSRSPIASVISRVAVALRARERASYHQCHWDIVDIIHLLAQTDHLTSNISQDFQDGSSDATTGAAEWQSQAKQQHVAGLRNLPYCGRLYLIAAATRS